MRMAIGGLGMVDRRKGGRKRGSDVKVALVSYEWVVLRAPLDYLFAPNAH